MHDSSNKYLTAEIIKLLYYSAGAITQCFQATKARNVQIYLSWHVYQVSIASEYTLEKIFPLLSPYTHHILLCVKSCHLSRGKWAPNQGIEDNMVKARIMVMTPHVSSNLWWYPILHLTFRNHKSDYPKLDENITEELFLGNLCFCRKVFMK